MNCLFCHVLLLWHHRDFKGEYFYYIFYSAFDYTANFKNYAFKVCIFFLIHDTAIGYLLILFTSLEILILFRQKNTQIVWSSACQIQQSHVSYLVFIISATQSRVPSENGTSAEELPPSYRSVAMSVRARVWCGRVQPTVGDTSPMHICLCYVQKPAETKPEGCKRSCWSSCPDLPGWWTGALPAEINPLVLPNCFWLEYFITATESKPEYPMTLSFSNEKRRSTPEILVFLERKADMIDAVGSTLLQMPV